MAGKAYKARLFAVGAVGFLLLGVLAGVALRPFAEPLFGKVADAGPAAERGPDAPNGRASARGSEARTGGAGPSSRWGGPQTPAVTFAVAEAGAVERRIDAVGASRSVRSVVLLAEAAGVVERVPARSGQAVKAGDLILKIESRQQEIELSRLKAQYPIAKQNAERFRDLATLDAASAIEAETAFNAFKTLEADLRATEFAISQRTIRAPFDGVVGLVRLQPGDFVQVGATVASVDDTSSLIVEFAVPQESVADVAVGQRVEARMPSIAGRSFVGEVTNIDTRVDAASRTLSVEARFDNAEGALIPGAALEVTTSRQDAPAIAVPGLAVQWDRTGAFVWKVGPDTKVVQARVAILQRRDAIAFVAGDIEPGDVVVHEGADRVRPGMAFPAAPVGDGASARSGMAAGATSPGILD